MTNLFQGGLLGLAGKFPPRYINGVFSGQALGGIFASAVNVLTLATGADVVDAAAACFFVAVAFLTSSFVLFLAVSKTDFYAFYTGEGGAIMETKDEEEEDAKLVANGKDDPMVVVQASSPFAVLIRIWPYALAIFLTFAVTLACFPSLAVLVESSGEKGTAWADVYFLPVLCFLLFNAGDFGGRVLAGYVKPAAASGYTAACTLLASVLRLAFVPLFMACNANPNAERQLVPLLWASDYAYALVMAAFALSNGYLGSVCMMSAPQLGANKSECQTAAAVMAALLGLGLGAGSLMAAGFVNLL